MLAEAMRQRPASRGTRRDRCRRGRHADHRRAGAALLAGGGVQISASHNPAEYNGIKLFSAEGRVIPAAAGQQVFERYRVGQIAWVPHERGGTRDRLRRHAQPRIARLVLEDRRRRADSQPQVSRAAGLESRGRQRAGAAAARRTRLPDDVAGRRARRPIRTHARANRRKPGRRAAQRYREPGPTSASARIPTPTGWQ